MLNSPAAPSPFIPTYRPYKKVIRTTPRNIIMPTAALTNYKQFPRIPKIRKPRPRSAGASSRPMRNENIADLVRFFQEEQYTEEATTPKKHSNGNMDLIKAGQRRFRHLGQAKPEKTQVKSSDASSNSYEKYRSQQQHLAALQREGLLPGLGGSADKSIPSRTKQDVEAIGRPWLDDAIGSTTSNDDSSTSQTALPLNGLHSESLSLGDLAALVEFSVSFPDLFPHESSPPPYQARDQSDSQPRSETQRQPSSLDSVNTTSVFADDRRYIQASHSGNEGQPVTTPSGGRSLESRADEAHSTELKKNVQGHRVAGIASTDRQIQSKFRTENYDDDSCCGSNDCDCDDAKSLAVLLRATERLGSERRKRAQDSPEAVSASATSVATVLTKTASHKSIDKVTTKAATRKDCKPPHSLNQGVTDTPLSGKKLTAMNIDGVQAVQELKTQASTFRGADQPLSLSLAEPSLSKPLNAGPIPLKLVTECMTLASSKSVVPAHQPLSPPQAGKQRNLTGDSTLVDPRSASSLGPTLGFFPRPQAHLSPAPVLSRRSRSATPDVAPPDSTSKKGKKKFKRAPLYVITGAAPLPPPAKPLPLIPQSAGANIDNNASRDSNISGPSEPLSAPLEYREKDRDSPILGMNTPKLRLRKSWVGPRPSSRYSSRSNDASDSASNISDIQTSATSSPAAPRPESRRGRADHVHALRMRDLDASKKKEVSVSDTDFDATQIKRSSSLNVPSDSASLNGERKSSRRYRVVSAVPEIPLPRDPPINPQGIPAHQRRNSASSLSRSVATTHGYEGGLSRNASVTSGSTESLSIRHSKLVHASREMITNLTPRRVYLDSPSLPSSDEASHQTRSLFHKGSITVEADAAERKAVEKHHKEASSSVAQITRDVTHASESQIDYPQLVRILESRVASLERQNKMLQAALLAALDMGVSHDADSVHSRSTSPILGSSRIPTISERSSMLSPHGLGVSTAHHVQGNSNQRHRKSRNVSCAPDDASHESRGSFETSSSHSNGSFKEVEVMISDADIGDSARKSHQ